MLSENDLLSMNIAIIGMGVTGQAVAKYLIQNEYGNLLLVDKDLSKVKDKFEEQDNVRFLDQSDEKTKDVLGETILEK